MKAWEVSFLSQALWCREITGTGFLRDAEHSPPCRHLQELPLVVWFQLRGTRISSHGKSCSGLHGPGEPLGLEQWFLLEHSNLKPVAAAQGASGLHHSPFTCLHVNRLRAY